MKVNNNNLMDDRMNKQQQQQPTHGLVSGNQLSRLDRVAYYLYNCLYRGVHIQQTGIHASSINPSSLLKIRLVGFLYTTVIYIWAIAYYNSLISNVLLLALLSYGFAWLYFTLTLQDYLLNKKYGALFPICNTLKYYIEIIYQIAFCMQLPVTIAFWGFFVRILMDQNASLTEMALNVNLHSSAMILLLLDFFYNMYSFPIKHLIIVVMAGLIYFCINITYSLEVKPIYQQINWTSSLSYILLSGFFLMMVISHCFGRLIFQKWKLSRNQEQAEILIKNQNKKKQPLDSKKEITIEMENREEQSPERQHAGQQ